MQMAGRRGSDALTPTHPRPFGHFRVSAPKRHFYLAAVPTAFAQYLRAHRCSSYEQVSSAA